MIQHWKLLLLIGLLTTNSAAYAQVGRGGAGGLPGSLSGGSRIGGAQGLSGRRVNPNFNPRGSLSTFGNLNPRGSVSPALNLNPRGSLLRPVTGGPTSGGQTTGSQATAIGNNFTGTSSRYSSYRVPLTPDYRELRFLPRDSVRAWSATGLEQFEASLSSFANGEKWRTYLQLDKAKATIDAAAEKPLDEKGRKQLRASLERLDKLLGKKQYKQVRRLPGFYLTRRSLYELVRADDDDQFGRLMRSTQALNQTLGEQEGGQKWQDFLSLSSLLDADLPTDADSKKRLLAACETTKRRCQKIQGNSTYDAITQMPQFQATLENIDSLVQSVNKS